jgi:choline dehydrogenase-like flavoprotein
MTDPLIMGAGHIIGTYRMGAAKSSSVVDREQRSWDCKNLFLVGSGVFPTSATANPTLTIAALAFWAADTIANDLRA